MNVPPSLLPLVDDGIIEEVVRPLMSGKEAQVYLVVAGGTERVAKVYKDAQHRSFKHRADYTEGRRTRNSRDQRAVARRTKHGRSRDEAAWRSTEVDMIYRLRAAGVRVPEPYIFSDGVLVMEFITDAQGCAAPRLGDASLGREQAVLVFEALMQEVIRMLCAGVVHGDLSDFNVLLGARGPVVIDFPQALDAASNRNARNILIRDVDNLHNFLSRCSRDYRPKPFAQEMWSLFERGELLPDTKLRGLYRPDHRAADLGGLLREIGDARRDAVRAGLVSHDDASDAAEAADHPGTRGSAQGGLAARGGGAPRRRVEVVLGRPAPQPARQAPGPASRGSQPGGTPARRPDPSQARGGGRRGVSAPEAQALLAAQPVLTEAQRAKAAQIAEAARAAQAARAERKKAPPAPSNDPRGRRRKGPEAPANAPRGEAPRVQQRPGRNGAPPTGASRAGGQQASERQAAPRAGGAPDSPVDAPAKRRRRRRRGRSGGAKPEPSP